MIIIEHKFNILNLQDFLLLSSATLRQHRNNVSTIKKYRKNTLKCLDLNKHFSLFSKNEFNKNLMLNRRPSK